jgi:hypothetical protein
VDRLTALAEAAAEAVVRAGNEPVQRHRYVSDKGTHACLLDPTRRVLPGTARDKDRIRVVISSVFDMAVHDQVLVHNQDVAGAEQAPEHAGGTRLGGVPAVALLVAAAYGVALVVAAFTLPVYESTSSSSSDGSSQASDTLVGANGLGVALVLGVPLLVTIAVGCALWQGSRWALPIAWTLTGLLGAANLLAMLSVGVFVLPVTAALALACARSRPPALPPAVFPPPQWAGS